MGGRHSASKYQRATRRRKRRFLRWRSLLLVPGLLVVLLGVSLVGAAVSPGNVEFRGQMGRLVASAPRRSDSAEIRGGLLLCGRSGQGRDAKGAQQDPGHGAGRAEHYRPPTGPFYHESRHLYARALRLLPRPCLRASHRPSPSPSWSTHRSLEKAKWQPTGPLVDGVPAMYVAQFRADDIYTSQITSAVWIDTKLLRVELVPGLDRARRDVGAPAFCDTA